MMLRGLGDDNPYAARIAAGNAYLATNYPVPSAFEDVNTIPGGITGDMQPVPVSTGQVIGGVAPPEIQIIPGVPNGLTVLGGGAAIAALIGAL